MPLGCLASYRDLTSAPAAANNPMTPEEALRRIAGEDLAPVKARLLLMLALTRTKDPVEIQRMFSEY